MASGGVRYCIATVSEVMFQKVRLVVLNCFESVVHRADAVVARALRMRSFGVIEQFFKKL